MRSTKLGDICEFKYGRSLPESTRVQGRFRVFGSNGSVGTHVEPLTEAPAIIIGRKGSIGEVHYSSNPCWPIDTTYYVDRSGTRQDIRWLYFALKSLRLTDLNKATGVPGLNRNDAYERKLVVPSLEEQQRIAAILDYADGIRCKRDQMLVMADEFLKSAFLEMFGHPLDPAPILQVSTLGQECDFFAGNSLPQGVEFTGQDNGLFLLKVSDLNSPGNETVITSARIWAPSEESVRGGVIAPEGAIVFPKRGGAIATNKKRILSRRSVLDPNLMAVGPKPRSVITIEYLRSWFVLIDLTLITSGSAVPQLNKRDLDPIPFVVPNPAQIGIFTELSVKTAKLIGRLRGEASDAFNLYEGLVQRAFHGEL